MTSYNKADLARRQLGTALSLYLRDLDPISVHALASNGAELAEGLVGEAGNKSIRKFASASRPNVTDETYNQEKRQYVNALKHFYGLSKKNKKARNDDELLS